MRFSVTILLALGAGLTSLAIADSPFATAIFVKDDPKTNKAVPVSSVRIEDENVCLVIRDVSTVDGDHALSLAIYDGAGREVYRSVRTITAKNKKWGRTICYDFNQERDAPGTWWYVAELDDQPLLTKELVVARAASAGAN
jgi:hypothetical protein